MKQATQATLDGRILQQRTALNEMAGHTRWLNVALNEYKSGKVR